MKGLKDTANHAAEIFDKALRIRCFVVDTSKPDGVEQRSEDIFCSACAAEQLKRKNQLVCENIHRHGVFQADRWGGKYEYLCPAGLAFIAAVLPDYDAGKCGLVAGPFLMVELRDFIEEDLLRFFPGGRIKPLRVLAENIPYLYSGRVSSIANLLAMTATYSVTHEGAQDRVMEQIAQSSNDVFYTLFDIKSQDKDDYVYPIQQEKLLQNYIAQGDKSAAQKVLNEILGHIFFCSGGDFGVIKARIIELVVILSRAAIQGGADIAEVFGLNYNCINDVQEMTSLDELNHWLTSVLNRFTNSVFDFSNVKHSDMIKRIMDYIRKNYMNKISLNDLAGIMHISVSYLSKIFKEETGMSISGFINSVRVDSAKQFLLDDRVTLIEAAYLSGFEDQSYFTKVFKKLTGQTPGTYRRMKGNI